VTTIDWLIVAFCALLAIYGFLQGFIVGALSLFGFAAGAFIGTRIGPLLLPHGPHSQYAPLFGLLGALLAALLISSRASGSHVGAAAADAPVPVGGSPDDLSAGLQPPGFL